MDVAKPVHFRSVPAVESRRGPPHHIVERYKTVKQHDVVSCPTCGEELAVVSSVIPEHKKYVCSQCESVVGSTRGRFEFGQIRVSSDEDSGRRLRLR